MTANIRMTCDGVSPETAKVLRAAMQRPFAGKPQRTDGRLTKENLWREAQVSRATMNRARPILSKWDARVAEQGKTTAGEARRDEEISKLRRKLADTTRTCALLEKRLKAAATAIAALHHDSCALRDEIGRQQGTNIALDGRRTRPDSDSPV